MCSCRIGRTVLWEHVILRLVNRAGRISEEAPTIGAPVIAVYADNFEGFFSKMFADFGLVKTTTLRSTYQKRSLRDFKTLLLSKSFKECDGGVKDGDFTIFGINFVSSLSYLNAFRETQS